MINQLESIGIGTFVYLVIQKKKHRNRYICIVHVLIWNVLRLSTGQSVALPHDASQSSFFCRRSVQPNFINQKYADSAINRIQST